MNQPFNVLDTLRQQIAAAGLDPDAPEPRKALFSRQTVGDSADLERILSLPRREWKPAQVEEMVELLSRHLRKNPTSRLRPTQAIALTEAHDYGGVLGPIGIGHGKCVAGDTEFLDATCGVRRTAAETGSFLTPALHDKVEIHNAQATSVFSGHKECLKISLRDGTSITVSADHPIWTVNGWKAAGTLHVNEHVGVATRQPAPETLTDIRMDEVIVLAGMLANGGCTQVAKTFSQLPGPLLDEFLSCVQSLGGYCTEKPQKSKCREFYVNGIGAWFRSFDMHEHSKTKRVPARLWGMSDDAVRLFLNRFWAMDGYLNKVKGQWVAFECVLASEKLIDDLRFLLLRLGIRSRKKFKRASIGEKQYNAWRLTVSGEYAIRFYEQVGPLLGKEEKCHALYGHLKTTPRNPNYDVVPFLGRKSAQMATLKKETGRSWRGLMPTAEGQFVGRRTFQNACRGINYQGSLAYLASEDVAWEQISHIESVGILPVFDLCVPGPENFLANGVIVHNTLISLLMPVILRAKQPLIVVPAKLREKTYREAKVYAEDWHIAPYFRVESYETLGRVSGADILVAMKPDLIVLDEAHRAKNPRAAVTRRLKRYIEEANPTVIALSGTIIKRSIKDFAHLARWALPKTNPTPESWEQIELWAQAIDEKSNDTNRVHPGELVQLCNDEEARQFQLEPIQAARHAFRRRLVETPGVVATKEAGIDASLSITMVEQKVSAEVEKAFSTLRRTWETPCGEPIADAVAMWRHARELALGFYYRWKVQPPPEWLEARRAWAKHVRETIKTNRSGLDSELQVAQAIGAYIHRLEQPNRKHEYVPEGVKNGVEIYQQWTQIRPIYTPETEAVWLGLDAVEHCAEWARHHNGIVWSDLVAFAEKLADVSGLPYYSLQATDKRTKKHVLEQPAGKPMICSVQSVGEGMNLQAWHLNLVASAPPTGSAWEQMIGRTHRAGQTQDEVEVVVLTGCTEQHKGVLRAQSDSHFQQTMTGEQRRLCVADKIFWSNEELLRKAAHSIRWAKSGLDKDD